MGRQSPQTVPLSRFLPLLKRVFCSVTPQYRDIKKTRGAYFNYILTDSAEKQERVKSRADTSDPSLENKGRLTADFAKVMSMRRAIGDEESDRAAVETSHAERRSRVD